MSDNTKNSGSNTSRITKVLISIGLTANVILLASAHMRINDLTIEKNQLKRDVRWAEGKINDQKLKIDSLSGNLRSTVKNELKVNLEPALRDGIAKIHASIEQRTFNNLKARKLEIVRENQSVSARLDAQRGLQMYHPNGKVG